MLLLTGSDEMSKVLIHQAFVDAKFLFMSRFSFILTMCSKRMEPR